MKEKIFNFENVHLNYVETNLSLSNMPLLLIHGGTARWNTFETIISDLGKVAHVYAVDLRGHGLSGRKNQNYRLRDYVEDMTIFLKKCITKPSLIFGHSLGGMIALMIAAKHPLLVKGVIIGDAPLTREVLKEGSNELTKWRDKIQYYHMNQIETKTAKETDFKSSNTRKRLINEMMTNLTYMDPDVLTAMIDRFEDTYAGYKVEDLFPRIQCPMLLLQGNPKLGGVISDKEAEKALKMSPNLQHKKIKNAGHTLHLEDKEEVLAIVKPFITSFQ
ncbi:alpha/beta hydrolase [Priestia megaterium]